MDSNIKARWIEALRSGEYEQGTGQLKAVSPSGQASYCCLGVLCDVMAKDGFGAWDHDVFIVTNDTNIKPGVDILSESEEEHIGEGVLPIKLANQVGLSTSGNLNTPVEYTSLIHGDGRMAHSLVALNDSAKLTFDEIAHVIEEQF